MNIFQISEAYCVVSKSIQFNSIYFVHLIQKGVVTHRIQGTCSNRKFVSCYSILVTLADCRGGE